MKPVNLQKYLAALEITAQILSSMSLDQKVDYLNQLYFAHVKTFAYSNFELRHIAQQHILQRHSLSFFHYPQLLSFEHGGYCYQSAGLMGDALTQLGFKVEYGEARSLLGAAVNDPEVLKRPPTHLFLMVTLDDKKFLLDPGLASAAPRLPILITDIEDVIKQDNDEYKFYKTDGVHVLEKLGQQGWLRVVQTDLTPISQSKISKNLLQLERHPAPIAIRDNKTLVSIVTDSGRKVLLWDDEIEQLKFTTTDGDKFTKIILTDYSQAEKVLISEFNINDISAHDLATYCRKTVLPLPIKPWTIDFPLDEAELQLLEENLNYHI